MTGFYVVAALSVLCSLGGLAVGAWLIHEGHPVAGAFAFVWAFIGGTSINVRRGGEEEKR